MCTESQHQEKLAVLGRIETLLTQLVRGRPFEDQTYMISDTQGFNLDYKNRRHVYILSKDASLVLDLKTDGQLTIPQDAWVNLDYMPGLKLFTIGTATPVTVKIRATDEVIS